MAWRSPVLVVTANWRLACSISACLIAISLADRARLSDAACRARASWLNTAPSGIVKPRAAALA